ncbi:MAG: choline/carnitine O-acyltransferase [Planctomycetaceae bacterium]|nr:choline/carnitine O-acyltransferase [Planctomycetaceae bacterium]
MSVYASDPTLPALPIPELADSCEWIKELARPINSPEVWRQTCAAADAMKVDGLPLQERLLRSRDERGGNRSWLRPMWDDMYLEARGPLPMEVNYVLQLKPERWGGTPLASFTLAMCRFLRRIAANDLPVESGRAGPLTMDSLASMAYTRIPKEKRDILAPVPLTGPATVAVVWRGRWFILTVTDADGRYASADEVDRALAAIRSTAGTLPDQPPVGAVTVTDRDEATSLRARLLASPTNRESLDRLENALFVVSLDSAVSGDGYGRDLIAGDAAHRWFDKSLQIITAPDGEFGANFEHSGCDAGFWIYALNLVDAEIASGVPADGKAEPRYAPLTWDVDDGLAADLQAVCARHAAKAAAMPTVFRSLTRVTREIVKSLGCGPDIFAQLAFQSAWYALTGTFGSAYEAVAVRGFYQGRTEVTRPATAPALAFAKALADGETTALRDLYTQADREHKQRIGRCQQGQGAERHMFGLRCMAERDGLPLPSLFSDAGWNNCTRNTLSTSSVTAPCVRFFAFGPVLADGIGIGYAMAPDCLQFTVTSLPDSKVTAPAFADAVDDALAAMIAGLG